MGVNFSIDRSPCVWSGKYAALKEGVKVVNSEGPQDVCQIIIVVLSQGLKMRRSVLRLTNPYDVGDHCHDR